MNARGEKHGAAPEEAAAPPTDDKSDRPQQHERRSAVRRGGAAPPESEALRARVAQALARQSVPGLLAQAMLAVVLATTAVARSSPGALALMALWFGLVGVARLSIARSFSDLYPRRPRLWRGLFAGGVLLSSATWGVGGAVFVGADDIGRDSSLVLIAVAGVCVGGLTSLSADVRLLRLHVACLVIPAIVAGLLLPGSHGDPMGSAVVIVAFGAFLWVQGAHVNASFVEGLRSTRALERQAADLEVARLESLDASRVKSEFLANMSHEIRTPLAAVVGYADLLLDPAITHGERVSHIQTIRRNGEHLMSLVNDVLDISKIEAGKMTVESIPTSPRQIIFDVASLMRARAAEKNLTFNVRYATPLPEVIQSDPTRLRQIVLNLVGNAVKFTEKGGVTIVVRCEAPESANPKLAIDVSDTGVGMTVAQMDRIFASFAQADASTTRRFGGTGLGLAISRRLAGLLGGDITVRSSIGVGTLLRLTVATGPLRGVPMRDDGIDATLRPPPSGSRGATDIAAITPGSRVLLAEDGYDNRVLVSTFLTRAGVSVKMVEDGQAAVEEALSSTRAGRPYDVILMDMQMPVLDGYGAASTLRHMGYTGAIVALTAHAMTGDRERCMSAGCDEYMTKPIERARLLSVVDCYARRRPSAAAIVSTFSGDNDMKHIVEAFVRELPERSVAIVQASRTADKDLLRRLTHQLRGSAGGYGFPAITEAAKSIEESLARGSDCLALRVEVDALDALCRNARAC